MKTKKKIQKLFITFVVIVLSVNIVNAQQDNIKEKNDSRIAVLNEKTQRWGYTDTSGIVKIPFIYACAETFTEGFAFVSDKKSFVYIVWKVVTISGKEIPLPEMYDYVDMFKNKLFIFENTITIYDTNGVIVLENTEKYLDEYRAHVLENKDKYKFWNHPLL